MRTGVGAGVGGAVVGDGVGPAFTVGAAVLAASPPLLASSPAPSVLLPPSPEGGSQSGHAQPAMQIRSVPKSIYHAAAAAAAAAE